MLKYIGRRVHVVCEACCMCVYVLICASVHGYNQVETQTEIYVFENET